MPKSARPPLALRSAICPRLRIKTPECGQSGLESGLTWILSCGPILQWRSLPGPFRALRKKPPLSLRKGGDMNYTTCGSYRRAWELFRVQLWILLVLHKLILIAAQLVYLMPV